MTEAKPEVVICKDNAVFWLDSNGRWCNRHGPFAHKKIIDYFNRSIGRDKDGYYVFQDKGDVLEKVYFRYEDTALFVFDVDKGQHIELVLNSGHKIPLQPENIFINNDILYVCNGNERIRFTDKAMMKIASMLEEGKDGLYFNTGKRLIPIVEADKYYCRRKNDNRT